jgi:hypothetical protein
MDICVEEIPGQGAVGYEGPRTDLQAFDAAVEQIESAVLASCDERSEWPARITAGINAAIEFMVANPGATRALAIDSRARVSEGGSGYQGMIGRFAGLLGAGAPRSERLPGSSDESVIAVIAAIVSRHIRAGTVESLREGDPDLVFLALLPYVGFAEACRWSATL